MGEFGDDRVMNQRIAFVRAKDNINIAYAESGAGPPLVRAGTWLTHVQHDWESPVWMHWLRFMSSRHRLVRYDPRGCGLSQSNVRTVAFDDWVHDLEAVVDHLELERFPLFGMSQGAAVAAEYAIRHPERVSHLTLYAPLVTGWRGHASSHAKQWQSIEQLVETGWGEANMAFAAMFAHLFLPNSPVEHREWYAELQRKTASKEVATSFMNVLADLRMFQRLKLIQVPTLVIQIAHEQAIDPRSVPGIASEISGSTFASIDSSNHVLLSDEPGWQQFKDVFTLHVPGRETEGQGAAVNASKKLEELSKRELEILMQIAQGLSNQQIGERLFISDKTVRNRITHIFEKLGVSSRAQAIVFAKEAGL
jgi:pimeloyl-ACP methyl ester carboxylesterase/DNA-binding CsgD family transcriptional regulator